MAPADRALARLAFAVLLASATWFAGTAVAPVLASAWRLSGGESAALTSATQLGFIAGTLTFAALNLADRYPPRFVFAASAVGGAAANAGFALCDGLATACVLRCLTGVAL